MNYRTIVQHTDIEGVSPQNIIEVIEGHRYIAANRYTGGWEDINFMRVMTYKEMLEHNLPQDFINAQVPETERDCESCKYYIISEGIFTQDVAAIITKRLEFQTKWLSNGFYQEAWEYSTGISECFERYEKCRKVFGFYHKPYTKEGLVLHLGQMDEQDILENILLLEKFFSTHFFDKTKKGVIEQIKNGDF